MVKDAKQEQLKSRFKKNKDIKKQRLLPYDFL